MFYNTLDFITWRRFRDFVLIMKFPYMHHSLLFLTITCLYFFWIVVTKKLLFAFYIRFFIQRISCVYGNRNISYFNALIYLMAKGSNIKILKAFKSTKAIRCTYLHFKHSMINWLKSYRDKNCDIEKKENISSQLLNDT